MTQWRRQDFVTGGSEVWVYRGSRVRSPPVPVVLSVYQRGSLLDGLAMHLSCDTKKFHDNESTHILHNFWTSTHTGGSFPPAPCRHHCDDQHVTNVNRDECCMIGERLTEDRACHKWSVVAEPYACRFMYTCPTRTHNGTPITLSIHIHSNKVPPRGWRDDMAHAPPMAVRLRQKSRRSTSVRESVHLWWPAVAKLQAAGVPIA